MTTRVPSEIPSAQRREQPYSPLPALPPQPASTRAEEGIPSAPQTAVPPWQPTKGRQPTAISSPPASRTRLKAKLIGDEWGESENERHSLLPLKEVPTAPRIIEFVNVPLNTRDVRAFKKEMGRLLDDPFGVAERLDEFLGSSIYTFEDLMAILKSLFNNKEREMTKQASIRN
ncbi:hypothetical protein HGM15179_007185 [Zosterops borbonicus]|uniref:Uncharacterized protein n=1 Tax=Zosterops borbonicus TaxID=364589 RepID=A0A8K1GJ31_9PASS|nr:hypothetical protein HGM15179_007185 [Zosterops borbonicus]